MKKIVSKIIGVALGITLVTGVFSSIVFNNKEHTQVEAAVGSYSRNQSTYYTSAFTNKVTSSKYGTTLLNTLHELMYETHQSYNNYGDLWTYTIDTDYDIDNPENIILLYSRQSVNGVQNSDVWNREHVWCKSLSGGLYNSVSESTTGAGSDLHHLRPASVNYNSSRGNTPYGIIATHNSTTQLGDTDCYYNSSNFEPADYIKGDVARILMYTYTHYSNEISGTSTKSGALSITNIVNKNTAQAAWDLLMDWNELDPVDYQEMVRNNKCASLLGNYNPFIDHPEFARMIWDDSSSYQAGLFFQTSYKTVSVGSNYTNTATAWGNVSSSDSVYYTSDNPSVASVNSSTGQVTGVSNGVARIKARATINGISKISYHFVVVGSGYTPKRTINASGIVYTPTSKTTIAASETIGSETVTYSNSYGTSQLTSGKSLTLTINNFPRTISSMILYMHSNQKSGSGSITVTVGGSTYKSISSSTFSSIYGSYSQTFVPVDVTNASASKKTGTIVITISCSANSFYFQKAVIDYAERTVTKASSISVSPSSITMTPGEDNYLTTNFSPSTTTLQTCTWSSSNTSVATVNKYGLVRAVANGNATITATASDGSGKTGTTSVTVASSVVPAGDPTVTGVTVSPSSTSLDVYNNTSTTLSATVNGTNNPSQSVTWSVYSSSPSGCATVNSSGAVTAVSSGTAVIRATSDADSTYYGSCTVTITDSTPVVSSISATVSKTYYVGDVITSADITVKDNLDNTINNFTFANNNYQFTYSDASSGGSLTNKVFTNAITGAGKTCSLTVRVQRKAHVVPSSVKDTITATGMGVAGNSYQSYSNQTFTSNAVYSAQCMKDSSDNLQMRSKNNNSGLVSTISGGTIQSVKITVGSVTNTVQVYAKNTAYSSPADLYSNTASTKGTLIDSTSTTKTITFTGSYTYVGIRSSNGAIYLSSIEVTYGSSDSAVNLANYIMYTDTEGQCNTKFAAAKGYFEGLTSAQRATFMTSDDYVIATARERLNAWADYLGKTISYQDGDYVISNAHYVKPYADIVNSDSSMIIIVISALGLITITGYFLLRKRKEKQI